MTYLNMRIRQMKDKRFYVRYSWGILGFVHREYFITLADLQNFLSEIVEKTKWD